MQISKISKKVAVAANPATVNPTKLYVPVVTLSINDLSILENLEQGLKRTSSWNK